MLYRTIVKLIDTHKKQGNDVALKDLAVKIDIFYAAGKLSDTEYTELTAMLPEEENTPMEDADLEQTGGE